MPRKELAVAVEMYDDEMTLWLMPYISALNNIIQRKFDLIVPGGEVDANGQHPNWTWLERAFVMIEGNAVDAEFPAEAPSLPVRIWKAYWSARSGDLNANWEAFVDVATPDMTGAFWDALQRAQDSVTLIGDGDLRKPGEEADPNAGGATKKQAKTS